MAALKIRAIVELSMQRRQFILLMLAGVMGAVGLCGGQRLGRAAPAPEDRWPPGSLEAAIEQLFANPESARAVGRRYLERFPEQASRALLLENSGLAVRHGQLLNGEAVSRAAIDRRRKQDFLAGNTVILDGWILAQSEASLCALLALSAE